MFSVGLTGGIGSGKTQVADMLGQWGARVIDTDRIAHHLTAPGGAAMEPLKQEFGARALRPDGGLNRDWMRALVFDDQGARKRLEAIMHPLIGEDALRQAMAGRGSYHVFVVPLLAESGWWRDFVDRICVVDCDPTTQVARVRERSGLTRDTIERIMSAQASRQQRLDIADDVILNDGNTDLATLRARALDLHQAWSSQAPRVQRITTEP